MRAATQRAVTFQSTPSLRRATRHHSGGADQAGVSIHALLAESDLYARPPACSTLRFNPRPPCGERLKFVTGNRSFMSFQSTPSLRRATYYSGGGQISGTGFNPRPPCGERLPQRYMLLINHASEALRQLHEDGTSHTVFSSSYLVVNLRFPMSYKNRRPPGNLM